jgi:hypothetical protein
MRPFIGRYINITVLALRHTFYLTRSLPYGHASAMIVTRPLPGNENRCHYLLAPEVPRPSRQQMSTYLCQVSTKQSFQILSASENGNRVRQTAVYLN